MTPAVRRSALGDLPGRAAANATVAGAPEDHSFVTLAEVFPLDKVVARGLAGVEADTGRVDEIGSVATWHLDGDETIVVFPPDAAAEAQGVISAARSAVDVSSGYTVLRLAGPDVRPLLEEACAADLSERAVTHREIVQAFVANVRVVLARLDVDDAPAYTLLVARDQAEYLWDALVQLGAPHGLVQVGVVPG